MASLVRWKKRHSKEDKDKVQSPKLIGALKVVKFIDDDDYNAKAMEIMNIKW